MTRREIIRYLLLRTIGNFLLLASIAGALLTFGPSLYYEAAFRVGQIRGINYTLADDIENSEETELGKLLKKYQEMDETRRQGPGLAEVLASNNERVLVPPDSEFSIVIPKIGASARIQANVDPGNKEEYLRVLLDSIAHAKGTAYPGVNGTTYLFAHSADNFWNVGRYNAVFYLLKELEAGDEVFIFFQGRRYNYEVYDKKTVDASEIEYVDAALGAGERLILQTCWPPGTDWKRTLIFARPKNQ